jgi:hypothetical protein
VGAAEVSSAARRRREVTDPGSLCGHRDRECAPVLLFWGVGVEDGRHGLRSVVASNDWTRR